LISFHQGISGHFVHKLSVRSVGDADLHFPSTTLQDGLSHRDHYKDHQRPH
jgi:hypothetical protein